MRDIELLEVDGEVLRIATAIMSTGLIPRKAETDAAHIAVASRHGMDFLITWNCGHIANAEFLGRINFVIAETGYCLSIICTPDELFGGEENE